MRDNPYKDLPPLERRPDGSLYRMTPAQRKQANALIRRECCCYEDGNCMFLDDGDTCTCPQTVSFSVCCKWFRWAVLPLDKTLEAEIFRDKDLKRCAVCGGVFVPKSNRAKYCPDCAARVHRRQKTESEAWHNSLPLAAAFLTVNEAVYQVYVLVPGQFHTGGCLVDQRPDFCGNLNHTVSSSFTL